MMVNISDPQLPKCAYFGIKTKLHKTGETVGLCFIILYLIMFQYM